MRTNKSPHTQYEIEMTQTAEEFLASVGDVSEDNVNQMFDRLDIMDDPTRKRHDINAFEDSMDYDPEDEYHNEQQASGLHPLYGAFDDPDAESDDDDYFYIE